MLIVDGSVLTFKFLILFGLTDTWKHDNISSVAMGEGNDWLVNLQCHFQHIWLYHSGQFLVVEVAPIPSSLIQCISLKYWFIWTRLNFYHSVFGFRLLIYTQYINFIFLSNIWPFSIYQKFITYYKFIKDNLIIF